MPAADDQCVPVGAHVSELLDLRQPVGDDREQRRGEQHQHAHRGAAVEVAALEHQVVDRVAEHVALGAADQRRAGEVGEQRDVDEQQGDEDPGRDQRQQHPPEGRPPAGAEIARGLEHVRVDRLHRGVDRDHGVGQVAGREDDDDRELAEQQRVDRLLDQADVEQRLVDQALAPEQHPPGVDADHRVELVGEDEEEQQRDLQAPGLEGEDVGERDREQRAESPSPPSRSGRSSAPPRGRARRRARR